MIGSSFDEYTDAERPQTEQDALRLMAAKQLRAGVTAGPAPQRPDAPMRLGKRTQSLDPRRLAILMLRQSMGGAEPAQVPPA